MRNRKFGMNGYFAYFCRKADYMTRWLKILILLSIIPISAGAATIPTSIESSVLNFAGIGTGDSTAVSYISRFNIPPDDRETLRSIANQYLMLRDFNQARIYGQRLLDLAESDDDPENCLLSGHIILGRTAFEMVDPAQCYYHLENARVFAERLQDHHALSVIFNDLGSCALYIYDDTYTAISYYFQALEESQILGDMARCAGLMANIAGAYYVRSDLSGLKFAEDAIEMTRNNDKEFVTLFCATVHAANFYLMAGEPDRAESAVNELQRMYDAGLLDGLEQIDLLRAMLCEQYGDIAGAKRYYDSVMAGLEGAQQSMVTMVYLRYAGLLRMQHQPGRAVELLERCMDMIAESEVMIFKARIMNELSLCCREAGQYDKALDYAQEYQRYQTRIASNDRERSLNEARVKHDIYSREQQINRQQMVILNNRYKMTILAGVLAIVFVVLVLTYVSYRRKSRLYRAIVLQNRDYMQREKMLLSRIRASENTERHSQNPPPSEKLNELMSRFTSVMIERRLFADSSLTLAAVADELDTNRTYLSKAINDITGKNFTQIINDYRIREAIDQISDTAADKPLKQIAADVGFSSLSTFYSTFQTLTGMTPAHYRAKLKEV